MSDKTKPCAVILDRLTKLCERPSHVRLNIDSVLGCNLSIRVTRKTWQRSDNRWGLHDPSQTDQRTDPCSSHLLNRRKSGVQFVVPSPPVIRLFCRGMVLCVSGVSRARKRKNRRKDGNELGKEKTKIISINRNYSSSIPSRL